MAQALITPSRQLIVGRRGNRQPAKPVLDLSHPLSRGLVGCWVLGPNGASFVPDISPSMCNGTLTSMGATPQGFGSNLSGGLALKFNGTTQYINLAHPKSLLLNTYGAFSVFAESYCTSLGLRMIAGQGFDGGITPWFHDYNDASGTLRFGCFNGSLVSAEAIPSPSPLNRWIRTGGTYDGARFKVYADGKLLNTAVGSITTTPVTTTNVFIGAIDEGPAKFFPGNIGIVRFYRRALSDQEHAELAARPYAGIYEAGPRWRVGVAAAGGSFNPGWASGATRTVGAVF